MGYSFSNLSPADFEDLCRDLLGAEIGVRFEAFGPGPDGGMDGRHAKGKRTIILQAKHYAGSSFHSLRTVMAKERRSLASLRMSRYLLATSRALTPRNKEELASTLEPMLAEPGDIFGHGDLNASLRKFPDIERAHIKLWLSSSTVLDRIVHAAARRFTDVTRDEIEAKVRVYAPNPSLKEARDKLEAEHVIIISGPPGVGKTTLAEMISYAYLGEEWEYVAIRSLDDGFAAIVDARKQIFFFDDFLGRAALDAKSLASHDSELAKFIKRVRRSKNARFVLTTRAPIFEEARRVSEHLADRALDITKYVLDVGVYTRRIRARILYNHLLVAGTSREHIQALWDAKALTKIVDHPNYNPRIIEAMTDAMHVRSLAPEDYATAFLETLRNPLLVWDISFRRHIAPRCRHLLFSLFFCSEYGVDIDELRASFNSLHPYFCRKFAIEHDPKDFEEALKILEGGYIEIRDRRVSFVNPSLRDYLIAYLADDADLLDDLAHTAIKASWADELWTYIRTMRPLPPEQQKRIATSLLQVAQLFLTIPIWKQDSRDSSTWRFYDLTNTDRLRLLLDWAALSEDSRFMNLAMQLADKPVGGHFFVFRDGTGLVRLLRSLKDDYEHLDCSEALFKKLEAAVIGLLDGHLFPDHFEELCDAVDAARDVFEIDVGPHIDDAVRRQLDDVRSNVSDIDSDSTLHDYMAALQKYAPRIGVSDATLKTAVRTIESRIADINGEADEASPPRTASERPRDPDQFDDKALQNLFAPLLAP
jgi:DNA polymerase III delta prime subunit